MNKKGFAPILIILLVVVLGIGGYFVYQNQTKPSQHAQTTPPSLSETSPDSSQRNEQIPQFTPTPSKTPASASPIANNAKIINYKLPDEWQTIKSTDGVFEVGFDPNKFKASVNDAEITLSFNQEFGGFAYIFDIKTYNGESGRKFLNNLYKNFTWEKTYERNYTVNGKSSLFMYNVDLSMTTVLGMIPVDSSRAYVIRASFIDEPTTEKLIGTLKLLK